MEREKGSRQEESARAEITVQKIDFRLIQRGYKGAVAVVVSPPESRWDEHEGGEGDGERNFDSVYAMQEVHRDNLVRDFCIGLLVKLISCPEQRQSRGRCGLVQLRGYIEPGE